MFLNFIKNSPRVGDRAPRTGAEWLLLSLLPFLMLWKCKLLACFRSFTFFTVRPPTIASIGICYLQDLLLWCVVFAILGPAARAHRRFWSALVIFGVNLIALIYITDIRCRAAFFHDLTWSWLTVALRPGSMLLSDLPRFLGGWAWKYAIGSLVLLNASMLAPLGTRLTRRFRWVFFEGRRPAALLGAAAALLVLGLVSPPQPYHAEANIFTAGLFSLTRSPSHQQQPRASQCEQKRGPAGPPASTSPLSGVAPRKNVLMLIGETWGYWSTSLGDPANDRTPSLRALAQIGPIATKAYTQSAYSTKAIYGTLTGRYASPLLENVESSRPSIHALPRILGRAGYHTEFISAQYLEWDRTREQYAAMGFDVVRDAHDLVKAARAEGRELPGTSWGVEDEALLHGIIDDLPRDKPFFTVLYTVSTHSPYVCPEPELQAASFEQRRFLCALRNADHVLGELVAQLERRGLLRDTIIVFVGDHGENFANGRIEPRGCPLTEIELSVPLVIAVPGLSDRPGLHASDLHVEVPHAGQVDIVPTVVDLLGLTSDSPVQGRSLLGGGSGPPLYINGHGACDVAGVIEGDMKYLYDFDTGEAWSRRLAADPVESGWTPMPASARAGLGARLDSCSAYNDAHVRGKVVPDDEVVGILQDP
jgi:glucan phosphoethanolaminetransferase (alkaline phosphatase superfamily)